jgi:hypothetical protein
VTVSRRGPSCRSLSWSPLHCWFAHLGPGFHTVPIDRRIQPGLYFMRLIREDATGALDIRSRKFTVLR